MAQRRGPLDTEAYIRTSTLFAEKRKVLASEAVEELALDIVRRVSAMKHPVRTDAETLIAQDSIAAFCDALVQPSPTAALDFIQARQAEGVARQAILHGYLAGAAQMLGARWEADEAGFSDVIHGTGHLYSLLRAIQLEPWGKTSTELNRKSAVFAVVPGETHNFGVRLAAETFREAGWTIDLQVGMTHDELVQHVQQVEPDIIGLSLSTQGRLEALVRLVIALRLVRPSSIIGVAPALNMRDDIIHKVADVDAIFRDARAAVRDLDWMLQLRV